MTGITDLPLDVLLYNIMSDISLQPSDILGLCAQPGFVLLCRSQKFGHYLMRRYYPNHVVGPNPWAQFKSLALLEPVYYYTLLNEKDLDTTINGYKNLPIEIVTRKLPPFNDNDFDNNDYDKVLITVLNVGYPITGYRWIGGRVGYSNLSKYVFYNIYSNKEEAIDDLWRLYEENTRIKPANKLSYIKFSNQMNNRGYVVQEYVVYNSDSNSDSNDDNEYDDIYNDEYNYDIYNDEYNYEYSDIYKYNDYFTDIFSIHQVYVNNN